MLTSSVFSIKKIIEMDQKLIKKKSYVYADTMSFLNST